MLPLLLAALWALAGSASVPAAAAPAPAAQPAKLVDRVVAVVDEDPILDSDIERSLHLRLLVPLAGETVAEQRRRALDLLVEERLRLHEIDRFGFEGVPLATLDSQVEQVRSRFPSEEEYRAELARLGLDETSLRQLLARQLSVLEYVEERLGPRVFVSVDDIARYYNDELVPELTKNGTKAADLPTLDAVREEIRAVLRERRLNDEIDRWTAGLRSKADVVDYLDQDRKELPPLVEQKHR